MSIYDIAMLIVLGGAIWFGFWKGLAWQIASLAAVVVSYIVAVNFRDYVAQFIQAEQPWNRIGAMLILFLGTSLLIWTIYARVAKGLKQAELKGFDRQMGALLGAAKGAILCMVITIFSVSLLGANAHDTIHHSKTGPYVVRGIGLVSSVIPEEIAGFVDPHITKFQDAIQHSIHEPIGNHPQGQYPGTQGQPTQYPTGGQYTQDPNQVPQQQYSPYQGQWQTPATQAGYGSQQQQGYNNQQNGSQQQQGWGNQNWNNQQQYGNGQNQNQYQQPSNNWQTPNTGGQTYQNPGQPPVYGGQVYGGQANQQQYGTQNGAGQGTSPWQDFNISSGSKELLKEVLIEKAKEAAQGVLGGSGQQ